MTAYYNEIDEKAAAWLRELIAMGELPDGEVDTRSIRDVRPSDLGGFSECHFFAGVGVWAKAVRDSQLGECQVLWTGSCPCQPFSVSGEGKGFADERHLWPDWFWLIRQCRPDIVLGEQVANGDGRGWFDLVSHDMEGEGYAIGAADTPACGYGAPHIRNRLYFVGMADTSNAKRRPNNSRRHHSRGQDAGRQKGSSDLAECCSDGRMADTERKGSQGLPEHGDGQEGRQIEAGSSAEGSEPDWLADTDGRNSSPERKQCSGKQRLQPEGAELSGPGPLNGFWRDADWLFCRDNKWRPVKSALEPLANGIAGRVGLLRGAGNAIVLPQAQAFCQAVKSYDHPTPNTNTE